MFFLQKISLINILLCDKNCTWRFPVEINLLSLFSLTGLLEYFLVIVQGERFASSTGQGKVKVNQSKRKFDILLIRIRKHSLDVEVYALSDRIRQHTFPFDFLFRQSPLWFCYALCTMSIISLENDTLHYSRGYYINP